jgi:hypothetical protein
LKVIIFAGATAYDNHKTKNNITFYAYASLLKNEIEIERQKLEKESWKPSSGAYYNANTFDRFKDIGTVVFSLPPPDLEPLCLVLGGKYRIGYGPISSNLLNIKIPIKVIQKSKSAMVSHPSQIGKFTTNRYYENPTKRLYHGR